jgi:hypothetical protein
MARLTIDVNNKTEQILVARFGSLQEARAWILAHLKELVIGWDMEVLNQQQQAERNQRFKDLDRDTGVN